MKTVSSVFVLLLLPMIAAAQTAVSVETGPFILAGESDIAATMQVGIRVGAVRPQVPHVDFTFATLPEGVANGAFVGISDLDVGYDLRVARGLSVALRGGGSWMVAVGGGAAGFALGYNAGAGVVGQWGQRAGVRLDFTYRRIGIDGESYPLSNLTLGIIVAR